MLALCWLSLLDIISAASAVGLPGTLAPSPQSTPPQGSCTGEASSVQGHCVCLARAVCLGSHCATGHLQHLAPAIPGGALRGEVHGFHPAHCPDCRCGTNSANEDPERLVARLETELAAAKAALAAKNKDPATRVDPAAALPSPAVVTAEVPAAGGDDGTSSNDSGSSPADDVLARLAIPAGPTEDGKHCEWSQGGEPSCVECGPTSTGVAAPCKVMRKTQRLCGHPRRNGAHKKRAPGRPGFFKVFHPNWGIDLEAELRNCTFARCFDAVRCGSGPMSVWVQPSATDLGKPADIARPYGFDAVAVVARIAKQHPSRFAVAPSPEAACLRVATPKSFSSPAAMLGSTEWEGGKNWLLWESNWFLWGKDWEAIVNPDRPFWTRSKHDWGFAANAASSITPAALRSGFDVPTPLRPKVNWSYAQRNTAAQTSRQRNLLLGFRGHVNDWPMWWYSHRVMVAEHLHDPNHGILLEVRCGAAAYPASPFDFTALLLNSSFGFAPGGGGQHSYRFSEILQAGGIPVITTEQVAPFDGDIDWSRCLVRIDETRLAAIVDVLRKLTPAEIQARRVACAAIRISVLGEGPSDTFATALSVWARRLHR